MSRIDENGKLYETNFGELGLQVEFVKGYESPVGDTLLYNLTNMSQYNKKYLSSLLEKIAVFHHATLKLIDTKEAHFGIFDSTDETRKISLSQLLCNNREITIGLDNLGKPVHLDFKTIPHLLIAGTTGSGKSVLLHNLICNLMIWYGRNQTKTPQFIFVDTKQVELGRYRNVKNTTFISDYQQAIRMLQACVEEMDRRYNDKTNNYGDLYIVIDELADLMLRSKFEVEESLVRLAGLGRACGIHLIVATQTPRVSVISGIIKANFEHRIALKTASKTDSVVIIDHAGCEVLKGRGDSIVKLGGVERHCLIAYPENELIDKVITINRG